MVRITRRVSSVAVAGLVMVALTGCNASALSKRELVVHFSPSATTTQQLAARSACATANPKAVPEPVTRSKYVSDQLNDIRFRIDHANDKDIAQLESCLGRQPGVVGFDIPDFGS